MSLFSFGDITFSSAINFLSNKGLVGEKTKSYNIYKYPSDIGSSDKGHYMVIFINEQTNTRVQSRRVNNGDLPSILQNRIDTGDPIAGSAIVDKVLGVLNDVTGGLSKTLLNGLTSAVSNGNTNTSATEEALKKVAFTRTIRRCSDVVALYMPDTLNFVHEQQYNDLNLNGGLATVLSGGLAFLESFMDKSNDSAKKSWGAALKNLSPFVVQGLVQSSDLMKSMWAAQTGTVQNPMLEMLYSSPAFRRFRFDFMFYPRDETESLQVLGIIDRLRFHQAPEIETQSNGYFLIPPSEFDIKFYYNGVENTNIPKISTCVLEAIDLDFAPNGFAAYETSGGTTPVKGGTGMPVAIRLGLTFRETEYLTKSSKYFNRDVAG